MRARLAKGGDLQRIRNHVAYHTATHVAGGSLARLNFDGYVFASGIGRTSGHIYYDLADLVALHHASGTPMPGDPFRAGMVRVMVETRDIAIEFARRADHLLLEAFPDFGFAMKVQVDGVWRRAEADARP